ncbi:MAG TPA: integrase core domain-containing protein [Phycisphaerae bacterium]|nr:integrase core domain-containing protein [Phycisphaerae bacterium]
MRIGKLERWHKGLKSECIRPGTPLSLDDARRLVAGYVEHYNTIRLHSAIGYVAPADKPAGSRRSSPNGTASWRRLVNGERFNGLQRGLSPAGP